MVKKFIFFSGLCFGLALIFLAFSTPAEARDLPLTRLEQLGKMLFLDKALSFNGNQSCASCHAPGFGYTGPKGYINIHGAVYPGSIPTRFGDRKPPSAAYAGESPIFHYDEDDQAWVGGMFWDGRATGLTLGDPLAEQAKGPFLNPAEQALPDAQTLCWKVARSNYARLFKQVWGPDSLNCVTGYGLVYDQIGRSISAYEKSSEVNTFSSKFDRFWNKARAKGLDVTQINMTNYAQYKHLGLDSTEVYGLAVFNDQGKCSLCHSLEEGAAGYPLFTDFTYDNLGLPKNLENPVYKTNPAFIDPGLGGFLKSAGYAEEIYLPEMGKFKVPTLRNVDLREDHTVKAYGHNGTFKSLKEIVHFYNTRDILPWPAPEYPATVNTNELGNLGLNRAQEAALVSFLQTLSDTRLP